MLMYSLLQVIICNHCITMCSLYHVSVHFYTLYLTPLKFTTTFFHSIKSKQYPQAY